VKKEVVMKAPLLDTLLGSGHRASSRSVSITFGSVEKTKFELDFSAKCVPLAITALTLELGKLAAKLPKDEKVEVQGVRITGSNIAMKDDGTVALLLTLAGGAQLPLDFKRSDLVKLRDQIDEAATLADPKTHH
jgi:hypothetical protein